MTQDLDCRPIGTVVKQEDGSHRLVLDNECVTPNKARFEQELDAALGHAREYHVTVWWMHNSIRIDTGDELNGLGAWTRYTELNAEKAN